MSEIDRQHIYTEPISSLISETVESYFSSDYICASIESIDIYGILESFADVEALTYYFLFVQAVHYQILDIVNDWPYYMLHHLLNDLGLCLYVIENLYSDQFYFFVDEPEGYRMIYDDLYDIITLRMRIDEEELHEE